MSTVRRGRRVIAAALASCALSSGLALPAGLALPFALPGIALADTLNEALVAAYLGNPDLDAERARLRATDELVPQALSGWRPQLSIDFSYQLLRGQSSQGDLDANSTSNALTLRQNIYAGGGTMAQTSRAENLVKAGRAGLIATEQSVLLQAVNAYASAWRDLAVLGLALSNERVLRRQLQQTRDQFAVGEVARTDVAQADAGVSRAQSDVEQAKADLAASNATYKQVTGRDPKQLADPARLMGLPATLAEAQAIAESNPNIVAATHELFAARDDVDVAFANLLPSLDLSSNVGYDDEPRAGVNYQRSASIGLALSVPLYQGGAEYSRVRQNRETVQQQRSELEIHQPLGTGQRHHRLGAHAGGKRGGAVVPRRGERQPGGLRGREPGAAGRPAHGHRCAGRAAGPVRLTGQSGARPRHRGGGQLSAAGSHRRADGPGSGVAGRALPARSLLHPQSQPAVRPRRYRMTRGAGSSDASNWPCFT